ncbi:MAG TPA: carboxypeptidase-like regulatory domain-containing protein [Chloroflexia bacterium]|nr:carboxypeptidase-like regulatory domain-containing protein [Chloroflexia bacterium]
MNLISNIGKAIRTLGVMGIMLALAGFTASAAPSASASSIVTGDAGVLSVYVQFNPSVMDTNIADVVVQNARGVVVAKGKTTIDGSYAVKLLPGTYKVTVSANGFKSYTQSVTINSSQTSEMKVALESGPGPVGRR